MTDGQWILYGGEPLRYETQEINGQPWTYPVYPTVTLTPEETGAVRRLAYPERYRKDEN